MTGEISEDQSVGLNGVATPDSRLLPRFSHALLASMESLNCTLQSNYTYTFIGQKVTSGRCPTMFTDKECTNAKLYRDYIVLWVLDSTEVKGDKATKLDSLTTKLFICIDQVSEQKR